MTKRSRQCVVPKFRNRQLVSNTQNEEEIPCPGASTAVLFCNLQDCPPPVFEWTNWTPWSQCTEKCGDEGLRKRKRECQIVENVLKTQGLAILEKDPKCTGKDKQSGKCNIRPCSEWTKWGPWTPCSSTCGEGKQQRKRKCENITFNNEASKVMHYSKESKQG